jgi:hypothetical protein
LLAVLAAVACLILTASALAMYGRFDPQGKIVQGGTGLKVSGPFALESDEVGFVVHATVVQGGSSASGDSAYSVGGSWSATLSGTDTFSAGDANARATATVYLSNGSTESYTWTQRITLK